MNGLIHWNELKETQMQLNKVRQTSPRHLRTVLQFLAICSVLLLPDDPVSAQRNLKHIPPPDPELERKALVLADGFEINLFASDPRIAKPIQMNFDPQGRLWLVSSSVYPHIKPGQKANDRVLVLTDIDGDGRADKTSVFADGLLIPTGVEPGDGGAYVANSTELLHFMDTDGDGRADSQRVVLSGFGTEDTHHILHTLRWGPEGFLYMNQSIYIHSHLETPYGVRRLLGGGIWRFRPETMRLEVYARGFINPWGHELDAYGQSFASDGAGGEGINYVVPGAAYPTAVGVPRILHGLNPGSPKYAGLEIVGGRHLPEDWQGNILTNDFRGHRVCRFVITEDGSGFAAREMSELIKTKHVAFRPVDIKMGPDGAIYIADWYNPIIQHGEVDFRDPRRDHVHGRIWRVTYKGRKTLPRPKLVGISTVQLLEALKSPEQWTRHNAKRLLKERGPKILPKLADWLRRLDPNDPQREHHQLEALWVYQSLRKSEPRLLKQLLRAKDHRIRAAATRVIGYWQDRLPNRLALLERQIADTHPRVRLEAVRVLGQVSDPRSVEIAMRGLDQRQDRFLDYAFWLTSRELKNIWLPEYHADRLHFGGHANQAAFALRSVGSREVVPELVKLLQGGKLDLAETTHVLDVVAKLGDPSQLRIVFDSAMKAAVGSPRQQQLLSRLVQATRQRHVRPSGDLSAVGRLLTSKKHAAIIGSAEAIGVWKLETFRGDLQSLAKSPATDVAIRHAAMDGLAELGGAASLQLLEQLSMKGSNAPVRLLAVGALAKIDLKKAARRAVSVLVEVPGDVDLAPMFQVLLSRKGGPQFLTQALKNHTLPSDTAKISLRIVNASGRKLPKLVAALTAAGGIQGGIRKLSPSEMRKLVDSVLAHGDASRGEAVFRRSDLSCFKCHAIGGAGGRVGPDLLSLGASAQIDYLIESLIDPSKKIKENYQTLLVVTDSGKIMTGIKVRKTDVDLILRDAEDREIAIPLSSIEVQKNGASMMPLGVIDKLTQGELLDLVRFLSALGKVGPYAVGKARLVRRWQVMLPTKAGIFRLRRTRIGTAATDDPALTWQAAYSTVAGVLPLKDLPVLVSQSFFKSVGPQGMAFARFDLNVTTAGLCRIKFRSSQGLSLWVDAKPIAVELLTTLKLSRGMHRLTLAVDLSQRKTGLQVELVETPGSNARVQVVGGK